MNAIETTLNQPMSDAESAVRDALSRHGFGILTEIDVATVLRSKIGVERPPLKILGACNPSFAHRALTLDQSLALVLPCNVVLEDAEGGRATHVSIADPRALITGEGPEGADLHDLAEEAADALEKALADLVA